MRLAVPLFISAVLGTWFLMHWYVYLNLASLGFSKAWLAPALWVLSLSFPFMRLFTLRWRNPLMRVLYWGAALWMGSVFLFSFWFLIASGLRRMAGLAGLAAAADPGAWTLAAGLGVLAMIAWGLFNAMRAPREVRYAIDRSPRYRRGKSARIVQVSDVHLGLTLGTAFLTALVARINALEPDLVFITGDLLDPEFPSDLEAAAILRGLSARQGVFAVTGNHEFYAGLGRFLAMMESAGIPVLANETRRLGSGLQIAGIHDQSARRFARLGVACDPEKALRDIDHDMPVFLLAHQPKHLEHAQARRVDLIFSGHTHAGQIFPFRAMVRLSFRYLAGKYALGSETDLIVNTGTGFWGPPLRVGTDSQVVVVDFRY
jgi:uncharacterized protein